HGLNLLENPPLSQRVFIFSFIIFVFFYLSPVLLVAKKRFTGLFFRLGFMWIFFMTLMGWGRDGTHNAIFLQPYDYASIGFVLLSFLLIRYKASFTLPFLLGILALGQLHFENL